MRKVAFFTVLFSVSASPVLAQWSIQTVATGDLGTWSSLALDQNGNPTIACCNGSSWLNGVFTTTWNGTSWQQSWATPWAFGPVACKIDSVGNLNVAWSNGNQGNTLQYQKVGNPFQNVGQMGYYNDGVAAGNISLQLDSKGQPCVSYYDGINQQLMFGRYNSIWWTTSAVNIAGTGGYWNSLALFNNQPAISYLNEQNGLMYAQSTGTGWSTSVVDATPGAGYCTSLAFEANGDPCIAYANKVTGDLMYAQYNGSSWATSVVDTGGVGWYDSLVLDQEGNPHISYYDYSVAEIPEVRHSRRINLEHLDC